MPKARPNPRAKRPGPPQPEQDALRALVRAGGLLRRHSESHFARYGVSPAQWGVLRALHRLDESGYPQPRMHELGAALLVQPPSLSATIDRMHRLGLITRIPDPTDHRTRRVGLTDQARRLLSDAQQSHNLWIRTIMGGLSPAKLRQFADLLTSLSSHMELLAEAPAEPQGLKRRRPGGSPE